MSKWDDKIEFFTGRPFEEQIFHPSRRYIPQIAFGDTLECGCASAIDYVLFKILDKKYTGIDITDSFLIEARMRGAHVVKGSITDIQYPAKSFDTVYCRHVLEHLSKEDTLKAIHEMKRVSRHLIAITFFIAPNEESVSLDYNGFFNNRYNKNEIVRLMSEFGMLSEISFFGDQSTVFIADNRFQ